MIERIDIYDAMTSLLHGTLFLATSFVLFPQVINVVHPLEAFEVLQSIIFICIAYFLGQIITSISSFTQPLLFWTWGGMPSAIVFSGHFPEKYLAADVIDLAKNALQKTSDIKLSDAALFSKAMGIARKVEGSLSERHNQMYAYNRTALTDLILMLGLFVISCFCGLCKDFGAGRIVAIFVVLGMLLILHWYRAKQRAFYYVREVIVVAERELSGGV